MWPPQTNEFAFNGPYAIDVYYDPVAKSHSRAQGKDHVYIGTVAVFARPDHCEHGYLSWPDISLTCV